MPGFSYGHFFYALKPVSLRTAAYVGTYNAVAALLCGGRFQLLCCLWFITVGSVENNVVLLPNKSPVI